MLDYPDRIHNLLLSRQKKSLFKKVGIWPRECARTIENISRIKMVVARASGTDLASSLKQNTFLTLGVCPAGGPRGTGGPGTGGHGGPGTGDTGGPQDMWGTEIA